MKIDDMLVAQIISQTEDPDCQASKATTAPAAGGAGRFGHGDRSGPADGRRVEQGTGISDAAFVLAAQAFDPHALTRAEMAALADQLRRGGAISDRDFLILQTDPTAGRMAVARDLAGPRDTIRDWQERRATDMELGRIQAVEASTRALAILGRVAALRNGAGGW